jgi:uncharacterized protein (TIGR00725 family)
MKVLIVGTWRADKAAEYASFAGKVGEDLAKRGHILVTGGGTGMSKLVVENYKINQGEKYIAIMPSSEQMKAVGEEVGPTPDEFIQKDEWDYPMKNVELVRACDVMIALPGGLGSLSEIIHAVKDYGKKVAVLDLGPLAEMVKQIPELREGCFLSDNIDEIFEFLEKD